MSSPIIKLKKLSIDNGLVIILAPSSQTSLTSITMAYNLSTEDLLRRKVGVPHFTEHMVFPISTVGQNPKNFVKFISSISGKSWAETREDFIIFNSIFPNEKLSFFLKLEEKRMNAFYFDREIFSSEKEKIKRESFLLYKKKPYLYCLDALLKEAFVNTPYSNPLVGTADEIEKIKIEDVLDFHKDYFCPNNAILVVSGNFNDGEVIRILVDYFKRVPSGRILAPFRLEEFYLKPKIILVSKSISIWPAAHFGFRIFPQKEPRYFFYILEYILSNEMEKYFNKRFEGSNGTAFRVIANYLEKPILSLFVIFFITMQNSARAEDLISGFFKNLERVKFNLTEEVINSAKILLLSEVYEGLTKLVNKQRILMRYFLLNGDPVAISSEIEIIKMITKKDIIMVLDKYFIPKNMIFVGTNMK